MFNVNVFATQDGHLAGLTQLISYIYMILIYIVSHISRVLCLNKTYAN